MIRRRARSSAHGVRVRADGRESTWRLDPHAREGLVEHARRPARRDPRIQAPLRSHHPTPHRRRLRPCRRCHLAARRRRTRHPSHRQLHRRRRLLSCHPRHPRHHHRRRRRPCLRRLRWRLRHRVATRHLPPCRRHLHHHRHCWIRRASFYFLALVSFSTLMVLSPALVSAHWLARPTSRCTC